MQEFIPVGITVPFILSTRDRLESQVYEALRRQKPPETSPKVVPQGLCVVNAKGRVLEWIQVFEDEPAFHAFLDRTLAAFKAAPIEPGPVPPKGVCAPGKCPNQPLPQRGSLVGWVYGRSLNAAGEPTRLGPDCREQIYMQEETELPRALSVRLAGLARRALAGERVAVPALLAEALIREAHLGPKDVRLLDNPLKGETTKRKLTLILEAGVGGEVKISGESDLRSELVGRFKHDQTLSWRGSLSVDAKGVKRLVLVAQGRYSLRWRGADEANRFRQLFAGRDQDVKGPLGFGLTLTRAETGREDAQLGVRGRGPDLSTAPVSLRRSLERMQRHVKGLKGRERARFGAQVQGLPLLLSEKRWKEAEALVEKLLKK